MNGATLIANGNGTQWGQAMTAADIYTVAGSAAGTSGNAGDGGLAAAALMANCTAPYVTAGPWPSPPPALRPAA